MEPISVRWKQTRQFRSDGILEVVTEGVLELPDLLAKKFKTGTSAEDAYEDVRKEIPCGPPVEPGFRRESAEYTINMFGVDLEFKFVDVEQPNPNIEDDPTPIIVVN